MQFGAFYSLCILLLGLSARSQAKDSSFNKFEECEGETKVVSAKVSGCENGSKDSCNVKAGKDVTVLLDVKSDEPSESLFVKVFGVLGGANLPFPGKDLSKNICDSLKKGSCPFKEKTEFSYELKMTIPTVSKIKVKTRIIFENEKKKVVGCALIPTNVV